ILFTQHPATAQRYPLSLHDALPISGGSLPGVPAASALSASASSTAARQGAHNKTGSSRLALPPNPGPASNTAGLSANCRRAASASSVVIPPSGAVWQGRAQHSGVRVSTSCSTGSTAARYTSPAPQRSAPSQQRAAAPRYCRLPATAATRPKLPLFESAVRLGSRANTSAA